MNDIRDFIRYGFPGYVVLGAAFWALRNANAHIASNQFLKAHDTTASLLLLIAGPFVGFLVHQIYFVYFDWTESYDKVRRPCLRILADWYSAKSSPLDDRRASRLAYVAWKFLMTNMTTEARISETFLRRLSDLHNYAHSFGAIVTSALLGLLIGAGSAAYHLPTLVSGVAYFVPLLGIVLLFWHKRRDVVMRADIFERAAILEHRPAFMEFMSRVEGAELATPTGFLDFSAKFEVPAQPQPDDGPDSGHVLTPG